MPDLKTRDRKQRVTQAEIARRCGISRVAVAASLGDVSATTAVSPATAERVRRMAKKLGYRPNRVAQQLIRDSPVNGTSATVFRLTACP